ncbi:MAG: hypothetical protein J0I12_16295 [Candidatus Eremiobacteraeota bacterium]|nr:hypothetical protein [Candidatus Eremiobacteraeota bacterium]
MIVLEDFQGLVFLPPRQIATLTPFLRGWWRAVTLDGEVLHLPQKPEGPWVPLGESWVWPPALSASEGGWNDRAGFFYPGDSLPPFTSQPEAPPERIWGMRSGGGITLLTDDGAQPSEWTEQEALQRLPQLVQVGRGLWGNRNRFHRLRPVGEKFELILDNGQRLHSLHPEAARQLAQRLGLPDHNRLEPVVPGMRQYKLRDWPEELYNSEAEQLKAWFDDANVLIANCLLQCVRYRRWGIFIEYGDDHRGFWYKPVSSVLYRAGFIDADEVRWVDAEEITRESKDAACLRYRRVVERAVGELKWFRYQDLGFRDPGGRVLGSTRPQLLFLVEKRCLEGYARKLADHFGFTYLISGGATKIVDTEFLVHDLVGRGVQEVEIYSFADFDPEGSALTLGFVPQLEGYGMKVKGEPKMVVHPSCFTDRELRLFALPCPMTSAAAITMAKRWVERTGGIHGQAFGIGSDHLQPIERVIRRLEELGC